MSASQRDTWVLTGLALQLHSTRLVCISSIGSLPSLISARHLCQYHITRHPSAYRTASDRQYGRAHAGELVATGWLQIWQAPFICAPSGGTIASPDSTCPQGVFDLRCFKNAPSGLSIKASWPGLPRQKLSFEYEYEIGFIRATLLG